jgi:hypothetical protein
MQCMLLSNSIAYVQNSIAYLYLYYFCRMLGEKTNSGHGQMTSKDTELFPSRERVTHTS